MSLSPLDSPLWSGLFGDPDLSAMLGDEALLAAMVRVEVALAQACAQVGIVPAEAAREMATALADYRPDPAALAEGAARDGVAVPALLADLRARLSSEASQALHWGATSQDIVDSATALVVSEALALFDRRLVTLGRRLGALAEAEADTVMAARTRSQIGLPTTFGALLAVWGQPVLDARDRLAMLKPAVARLSLHGAVGSDAALGDRAAAVRETMGATLGLTVEDLASHARRERIVDLGAQSTALCGSLGKIGLDVVTLTQSGIAEVKIAGGGSSTMPHKSNPVAAEALVSLARHCAHLQGSLFESALHGQFRDGAAWALEWMSLRPILVATGAALRLAQQMLDGLEADAGQMRANLDAAGFGPYAERAIFTLAETIPRDAAKTAVRDALATPDPHRALLAAHPELESRALTDPLAAAGQAPKLARAFAQRCKLECGDKT
ncbi:lyase family protein [Thioclava atlantica]|uniref:3-carboxy-cis,cis-muconate cycloisomerase n=1 Tax=Thioclava atlantica TaxID=1317124 RepID=A0A085TT64_9RHOB|nr:lyase family protein [Thioclava atlantica]KFE33911.1 3-carboxy-cis,cis-muconate cycloisomerase [Thioclava atlantica]